MPRSSAQHRERSPEGSWVLDGDDTSSMSDSDIDAEDDTPFDSVSHPAEQVAARTAPVKRRTGNARSPRESKSGGTRSAPAHRSPRHATEPELVMPSIDGSRSKSSSHNTNPNSVPRLRKRKNSNSRPGTGFHQDSRRSAAEDENVAVYARLLWTHIFHPVLDFVMTVLSHITRFVRPLLAVLAAVWIVAFIARQLISSTISRTLTPLCSIPGISNLDLPFCSVPPKVAGPVEFDQLMTVQSTFEDVLTSSAGGVTLPADMKRSESSIRDLRHVVQFSNLPSRNELVFEFGGFIDTAREASADLTRFNSRIGRAVDNVLSTNRWTLQVIDGAAEREVARGSVSRLLQNTILYPFQSAQVTEDLLLDQYLRHTRTIEEQIGELIIEAQALLGILQNLDDRLDVIHGITTRDGMTLKGSRDELFAQLWTKLGGNRSSKKKHDQQLQLLTQVSTYRKTAWDHVSGTLLKLQSISAGLEDLRERVAAPDVLGPRSDIPLKMHIDHIQMGIERLEEQRGQSRKVEGEQQQRILGKRDGQLQISS